MSQSRVAVVTEHLNDLCYAVREEIQALRMWQSAVREDAVRQGIADSLAKLTRAYEQFTGVAA